MEVIILRVVFFLHILMVVVVNVKHTHTHTEEREREGGRDREKLDPAHGLLICLCNLRSHREQLIRKTDNGSEQRRETKTKTITIEGKKNWRINGCIFFRCFSFLSIAQVYFLYLDFIITFTLCMCNLHTDREYRFLIFQYLEYMHDV